MTLTPTSLYTGEDNRVQLCCDVDLKHLKGERNMPNGGRTVPLWSNSAVCAALDPVRLLLAIAIEDDLFPRQFDLDAYLQSMDITQLRKVRSMSIDKRTAPGLAVLKLVGMAQRQDQTVNQPILIRTAGNYFKKAVAIVSGD
ncbi:unnamed protein product [Sympodiomycopsis kandeliae]